MCVISIGVCVICYGCFMVIGKLVDIGEVVGIVVVQFIGEFGIQLIMCIFYQGGVGEDIIGGLFWVQELFEVWVLCGKVLIVDVIGWVWFEDGEWFYKIIIVFDDGGEEVVYDKIFKWQWLWVFKYEDGFEWVFFDGDYVEVGQQLMEGLVDLYEVLWVQGFCEVQIYLVCEVQEVYCV